MVSEQARQVVVVTPTKSVGVAILLTALFGPLGMFYSTIAGAIVMIVVSILVGAFTAGIGLIVTWPICVIGLQWPLVRTTRSSSAERSSIDSSLKPESESEKTMMGCNGDRMTREYDSLAPRRAACFPVRAGLWCR